MTEARADARVPLMVGAIGHRDLVGAEVALLAERVRGFLQQTQRKYPALRVTVLTSLADGADRLVADAASELGVPIVYVLPMPSDLYERDFSGASLDEYHRILRSAEVLTLPLVGANTAADVTHPGPERDLQYAQLGAFIAAHCHVLLALWDGYEDGPSGGTATIIRYHQDDYMLGLSDGEPRSRLDATDDESDLVYHVVCSRDRPDGAPKPPLVAGETWWLTRDDRMPRTPEMPPRYDIVLRRMVEFSSDVLRHAGSIARAPNDLLTADARREIGDGDRAIADLFGVADWLSIHYSRLTLRALKLLYVFAGLASLCFIAYGDLSGQQLMIYPYLAMTAVWIGAYLVVRRFDWQRRWVDYRVLAEALRVQFYWAVAGVDRPAPSRFGHDAFLKRRDLELGWIRNVLRVAGRRDDAAGQRATDGGVDVAALDWVRGQQSYYGRSLPKKLATHRFTNRIVTLAFALGVVVAAWLALSQSWSERQPSDWLIALMGILPVAAALRQQYAHRTMEEELIYQYQFAQRILANAERQLQRAANVPERRRILRELGDALLRENGQWLLRQRERPIATVS